MTAHAAYVKPFTAAGDRRFVAKCPACPHWQPTPSTDRDRAQTDADAHTLAPMRGRT